MTVSANAEDGIYSHDEIEKGRQLGMTCIPGFSYKIKYDNNSAAADGSSKYIHLDDLSPQNVEIIREEYADAILAGLNSAITKQPPSWYKGQAPCIIKPNYYDSGVADSFDLTLNQSDFPFDPKSAGGKALHDKVLKQLTDHWQDITQ